jgi:hypothetical protein
MSTQAIQGNPDEVDNLLREGFSSPQDRVNQRVLNFLVDQDIIRVERPIYVRCANPDDPDYEDLAPIEQQCKGKAEIDPDGNWAICKCDECNREIVNASCKEQTAWVRIKEVQASEVDALLRDVLSDLYFGELKEKEEDGIHDLLVSGEGTLRICVPQYASPGRVHEGLMANTPTLFVHTFDPNVEYRNIIEQKQHVSLSFILTADEAKIESKTHEILAADLARSNVDRIKDKMREAVVQHSSSTYEQGTFFEKICEELFHRISESPDAVSRYLNGLKHWEGTVCGEIRIQMGAAGNPDLNVISKYDLMQSFFRGGFITDAKCLANSKLTTGEVKTVLDHLMTNDWNASKAVIIMYGDEIETNCWKRVSQYKSNNNGEYRIMIIPEYLFFDLLDTFDSVDLLDYTLDEHDNLVPSEA